MDLIRTLQDPEKSPPLVMTKFAPNLSTDPHPLKGTLSREKNTLLEGFYGFPSPTLPWTTQTLPPPCQHLYHCRVFMRFWFSLYCTMHPLGLRLFEIFIPPARRSRARRLSCLSKPIPVPSSRYPCPLLQTQKIFGTMPCPKETMTMSMAPNQRLSGSRPGQ